MVINRRKFIAAASGLFVPAALGQVYLPHRRKAWRGTGSVGPVDADTLYYSAATDGSVDLSTKYLAVQFTAGSSYTCIQCVARLSQGAATSLSFEIWSDNGSDSPGSKIGTGSSSVNTSAIGTSEVDVTFSSMSASVTSGTKYWGVINVAGTVGYKWYYKLASVISKSSPDGSTWSTFSTGAAWKFKTIK